MSLIWSYSTDGLDWNELAALYDAAPLGSKSPSGLKTAFKWWGMDQSHAKF